MSIVQQCPACWLGNHEAHNKNHGIRPGLIGGSWCNCEGECEDELPEEREQRLLAGLISQPKTRDQRLEEIRTGNLRIHPKVMWLLKEIDKQDQTIKSLEERVKYLEINFVQPVLDSIRRVND